MDTYVGYYEEMLQHKRKVFIAELDGEVAGLCTLVLEPVSGGMGKIWNNMRIVQMMMNWYCI